MWKTADQQGLNFHPKLIMFDDEQDRLSISSEFEIQSCQVIYDQTFYPFSGKKLTIIL